VRIATLKDSRDNARKMSAMPSCQVQRTLVKSPPELWAELSDPASLARHLGEFGEIRIARVEPETAVEWEGEDVRGAVQLKASGWGTKVTLTAVRETAAADTPPDEVAQPEAAAVVGPEPETEPEAIVEPEAAPETETVAELDAAPEPAPALINEPEPERRPGLFARIFRRRRKAPTDEPLPMTAEATDPLAQPEPAIADEAAPLHIAEEAPLQQADPTIAEDATPEPEPARPEAPEPELAAEERADLAAELAAVEQTMAEQDAALLTAVLDRLGAAHHRPFSRG
jgi:hypothetical protein